MVFCEIFLIKGLSLISGEQIILFIYLVALLMERLKNAMNKSLKNYSFTLFRIRVFFFFQRSDTDLVFNNTVCTVWKYILYK